MTGQDDSSNHYYVRNYKHFINLVNTALRKTFNECKSAKKRRLVGQIPGQTTKTCGGALYVAVIPYVSVDVNTNRVTLHAGELLFDLTKTHVFASVAEGFGGIL